MLVFKNFFLGNIFSILYIILILNSYISSFIINSNDLQEAINNNLIEYYKITPYCIDLKLCERSAYDLAHLPQAYFVVDSVKKILHKLRVVNKTIRDIVSSRDECKPLGGRITNRKYKRFSCFDLNEYNIVKVLSSDFNSSKFFRAFHNYIHKYYHFYFETIDFEKILLHKAELTNKFLKTILVDTITKLIKLIKVFDKTLSRINVYVNIYKHIDSVYTVYPIGKNSKLNKLKHSSINLKITSKTALITSSRLDYVTEQKNQMLNPEEYAMFEINLNNKCLFKKISFKSSDYSNYVSKNEEKYVSKPYSHFKVVGYKVVENVNYFILECIFENELGQQNETHIKSIYSR